MKSPQAITAGMKVKVYRNLRNKCLSIQYKGKVIAHVDSITLCGVTFKVSQLARARVLETKQKNVHAFVCGTVITSALPNWLLKESVMYNPYKYAQFTSLLTGESVLSADVCTVRTSGILI